MKNRTSAAPSGNRASVVVGLGAKHKLGELAEHHGCSERQLVEALLHYATSCVERPGSWEAQGFSFDNYKPDGYADKWFGAEAPARPAGPHVDAPHWLQRIAKRDGAAAAADLARYWMRYVLRGATESRCTHGPYVARSYMEAARRWLRAARAIEAAAA